TSALGNVQQLTGNVPCCVALRQVEHRSAVKLGVIVLQLLQLMLRVHPGRTVNVPPCPRSFQFPLSCDQTWNSPITGAVNCPVHELSRCHWIEVAVHASTVTA